MGKVEQARIHLRDLIQRARPGDRVASVASLSAAADGLSTAATVSVLREAMDAGWLVSTRGPSGGYWRTDKSSAEGSLHQVLADLNAQLQATLHSVQAVQEALARQTAG